MTDETRPAAGELTLFVFEGCPYCRRVHRALADLGLEIPARDIHRDPAARAELAAAMGGRTTVPVLRIEEPDGVRWLGESRAIIEHLYERFGRGKRPSLLRGGADAYVQISMWAMLFAGGLSSGAPRTALWTGACAVAAARSLRLAMLGGALMHWWIGGVFVVGAVSVLLDGLAIASIPWWYGAFAVVAVLILRTVVRRPSTG